MSTDVAIYDRTAWLGWHDEGIGGSDAAAAVGLSEYKSSFDLFLEKTRQVPRQELTAWPVRWGHRLESAIAEAMQERIGCQYLGGQVCYQNDELPWQRATLDRLMVLDGSKAIGEFKSVTPAKAKTIGEDGDVDSLPTEWLIQANHQMSASKLDLVVFGVFVGTFEDIRIFFVERNQELIDSLTEAEAEFWDCVLSRTPPPARDARDAEALIKHLGVIHEQIELGGDVESLIEEYESTKAAIKTLEDQKEFVKGRIIQALDGHELGVLPSGKVVKCSVTDVPGGTYERKPHRRLNLTFRNPKVTR